MKAITIPRFGGPDVLTAMQIADPHPGPGEVAIDVAYAGANYAEVLYRRGDVDVELPFVPGIEASGHVRALGDGVTGLRVGQPVAALTIVDGGAYAEIAVTGAELVVPLADDVDAEGLALAAGCPSNSTAALLIFDQIARLRAGETVLVHAAAGGVGSQLGQAARLLGADAVVGTVGRPEKVAEANDLGYDEVILRDELAARSEELTDGRGFDVIVDPVGGPTRRTSIDALALGGRLIAMGNASGADDVKVGANELWLSGKGMLGFNLAAISAGDPGLVGQALRRALGLVLDGRLRVAISARLPLDQAAEAHRRIESGATTGKLVLVTRANG